MELDKAHMLLEEKASLAAQTLLEEEIGLKKLEIAEVTSPENSIHWASEDVVTPVRVHDRLLSHNPENTLTVKRRRR